MRSFSSRNVWLRSDFSLAVTGFISAVLDHQMPDYGEDGGWAGDQLIMYMEEDSNGSVKEDLFYWASFVWGLLTNVHTSSSPWTRGEIWEPVSPVEGGLLNLNPNMYAILADRHQQGLFQDLEDARMGSVLLRAWKGEYATIEEASAAVRQMASRAGIIIVGDDEVDVGEAWEDIFDVVNAGPQPGWDQEIRFTAACKKQVTSRRIPIEPDPQHHLTAKRLIIAKRVLVAQEEGRICEVRKNLRPDRQNSRPDRQNSRPGAAKEFTTCNTTKPA
ncbi:hypothetical protein BCR34DRAFT_602223 [Clohesyomyces aquaticus]|uniref:Uncharacterized protein n=1 Tax=Clohesyomyces aquaticus TaxID=1231657 RepID=A0A1Y1ZJ17_9PLEO|nr:hypothetical protein BCR34DRAFT_602223 [Clohesyomyces aquaticus]